MWNILGGTKYYKIMAGYGKEKAKLLLELIDIILDIIYRMKFYTCLSDIRKVEQTHDRCKGAKYSQSEEKVLWQKSSNCKTLRCEYPCHVWGTVRCLVELSSALGILLKWLPMIPNSGDLWPSIVPSPRVSWA